MVPIFLALGSNLGNRRDYLKKGIESLARHRVDVLEAAGIYETEPKDVVDQPWYLNTVIRATTNLTPRELLEVCLMIEQESHRVRIQPKAARTLDIDIVFYDDRIIREPGLTIPHPRFAERRFVLVPLTQIAPDFIDPASQLKVIDLLHACRDTAEVRAYNPRDSF